MIAVLCGVPDCRFHNAPSIIELEAMYDQFTTPEYEADIASGLTHCEAFALSIDRVEADERDTAECVTDVVSPFPPVAASSVAGVVGVLAPIRNRAKCRPDGWVVAGWLSAFAAVVVVILLTVGGNL